MKYSFLSKLIPSELFYYNLENRYQVGVTCFYLYIYMYPKKKKKLLNCCFSFSNLWKKFYRIENKIHHTSINIILVNYNDIHKIYVQGNLLDAYSNVEEQNKTLNQASGPGVCVVKRAVCLHVNHHRALEEPWL